MNLEILPRAITEGAELDRLIKNPHATPGDKYAAMVMVYDECLEMTRNVEAATALFIAILPYLFEKRDDSIFFHTTHPSTE